MPATDPPPPPLPVLLSPSHTSQPKRHGRSKCRVCPAETANRVLLGLGVVGVMAGCAVVVAISIQSAGSQVEHSEAIKKILVNFLRELTLLGS